jgi:isopropylmalate/homocitrate/citramalate synthase
MISSQKLVQKIKLGDIYQNIYKSISPVLFDVSLRDGIQNAECEKFDTHVKKQIFHNIMDTQVPQYLEIGSLASFRFLPIMKDTVPLYHYAKEYVEKNNKNTQICVLVPSLHP